MRTLHAEQAATNQMLRFLFSFSFHKYLPTKPNYTQLKWSCAEIVFKQNENKDELCQKLHEQHNPNNFN